MRVFTVATENQGTFDALRQSCERNGLPFDVVGLGEKWEGWKTKIRLIREYLVRQQSPAELVLYTDAYDSFFLPCTPMEIQETFINMTHGNNHLVVFSATATDSLTGWLFGKPCVTDKNVYFNGLNAGGFIGRVDALRTLFDEVCTLNECSSENLDDQEAINRICALHTRIVLDTQCQLFYNFEWADTTMSYLNLLAKRPREELMLENSSYAFDHEKKRLVVKRTGTYPIILHANGNASCTSILSFLGLPPPLSSTEQSFFQYSTVPYLKTILRKCMAVFLMIAHMVFVIIIIVLPFLVRDPRYLIGFILIYIVILTQWVLLDGACCLTLVENKLMDGDETTKKRGLCTRVTVDNGWLTEKLAFVLLTIVPGMMCCVMLFRLYKFLDQCRSHTRART